MARTMKSYVRAAGSGLALASVALGAAAQQQPAATPVQPGAAQVVVRDAVTGQLRAASADEAQALHSHAQRQGARASVAAQTSMPRAHWSGARGARVTDEFATYSILVKQPDGSLKEICVEGRSAADAALKAPALAAAQQLPTE